MSPPRELGDGTERDARVRDTPVDDEPRFNVVLIQRLDSMTKEAHQARQDLSTVAGHVRALRQEVDDLRAAAAELLRRTAPVEKLPAPTAASRSRDTVYLAAGVAVAVVAVLLTIYLFTRT